MDRVKKFSVRKLYNNPEAKKVTIEFIIIMILGVISIAITSFGISKYINKVMIRQNIEIIASVIDENDKSNIVNSLFKEASDEKIKEVSEYLKSYGYSEEASLGANESLNNITNIMLKLFIPLLIIFLSLLYILFIKELKKIYLEVNILAKSTEAMSTGAYNKIEDIYSEGEMEVLISSLNYMGERVNNSIELLRKDRENLKDFLADISHQLKTPLASLVMFNDLLRENENMHLEDRKNFLEKSEEQLSRMEWLIMNLLKMGRLEANTVEFNMEERPLKDTIELSLSSLRAAAKAKNQELLVYGDLYAEVIHDSQWLAEAISNIVKNAIEHTKNDGKIEVEVSRGSLITKIYIRDNGPGISEEMQKKVFKRFYKGEYSCNPKSIGIGLSLAKSIIEEQKGEIKLISEKGKGTTFIISFIKHL